MPHLQTLVERHKNDPFVLIGINSGDSDEEYRKGLEKYGVSWLSAFQGETSPISDLYRVQGYPTYLLIDATGKIRERGHGADAMDAKIVALLEEMKTSLLE